MTLADETGWIRADELCTKLIENKSIMLKNVMLVDGLIKITVKHPLEVCM